MCSPAHGCAAQMYLTLFSSPSSSSRPGSPRQMERLKADMEGLQREGGGIESSLTY